MSHVSVAWWDIGIDAWQNVAYAWIVLAVFIAVTLQFVRAPYGRHGSESASPISRLARLFVGDRLAWFIMEVPSPGFFFYFFWKSSQIRAPSDASIVFFGLWMLHYINRTFVYPLRLEIDTTRPPTFHLVTLLAGVFFNTVNAFLNAYYLFFLDDASRYVFPEFWFRPTTIFGLTVFFGGMLLNLDSDERLRALRRSSAGSAKRQYHIPRGGGFELVSCANFLGELMEWTGFWILTQNVGTASFVVFTAANLIPRGVAHHKWYLEKFEDYPKHRKAVIPFLV